MAEHDGSWLQSGLGWPFESEAAQRCLSSLFCLPQESFSFFPQSSILILELRIKTEAQENLSGDMTQATLAAEEPAAEGSAWEAILT